MANWAQIDSNNIVTRLMRTDNNDPNGDEGYQTLVNTYGGTWLKASYNTWKGEHRLGGTPFRGNFPWIGYKYYSDIDAFMPPSPYPSWVIDPKRCTWIGPIPKPDSGIWAWDEEKYMWKEKGEQ